MPWNYPKLTRNASRKLVLILCGEIILISAILLTTIHLTWRSERWKLLNGHELEWHLGLLRNWAAANCDAVNEPGFHALCMAVFKQTFGTVKEVQDFICSLEFATLKIEPEFLANARAFGASCNDMRKVFNISLATSIMMVSAAVVTALVFVFILRLAYKQFQKEYARYYWLSFCFQLGACLLIFTSLIVYPILIGDTLPGLFHYVNDMDPSGAPIQKIPGGGTWGAGLILSCFSLLLGIIMVVLLLHWLPVAQEAVQIVKRTPNRKKGERAHLIESSQPSAPTSSFWAFMPEVFQPDVYVAECASPNFVGFGDTPSTTIVTKTVTGGPPPPIDSYTGLPLTGNRQVYEETYSYLH